MRYFIVISFFALLLSNACQQNQSKTILVDDDIKSYDTIEVEINDVNEWLDTLAIVTGDLDKDGIEEQVIIYDTDRLGDFGTEREMHIFKKNKDDWEIWHQSIGAILPSENGGVMGDPFGELKIEDNSIVIFQSGGSRFKWSYTHTFKYQNEKWELVHVTSIDGTPCEYWEDAHFDLNNDFLKYSITTEICNEETDEVTTHLEHYEFDVLVDTLPNLDNFIAGENQIAIEEIEKTFYY